MPIRRIAQKLEDLPSNLGMRDRQAVTVATAKTEIETNENARKFCVTDELQHSIASREKSHLLRSDVMRLYSGHRRYHFEHQKLIVIFQTRNNATNIELEP